jgi:hypothetical protein
VSTLPDHVLAPRLRHHLQHCLNGLLGPCSSAGAQDSPTLRSIDSTGAQEESNMLRKTVLAAMAAASFGVALAGLSTSASAEWGPPRHGWGHHHGHGYGPPPWVRRWHWRKHHWSAPPHRGPRHGHYDGRPVPRPHW